MDKSPNASRGNDDWHDQQIGMYSGPEVLRRDADAGLQAGSDLLLSSRCSVSKQDSVRLAKGREMYTPRFYP